MFKKIILILAAGFLIQFLISCGTCNPSPTFDMVHMGLSLDTRAEIENQLNTIEDSVRKENFRLVISLSDQEQELADAKKPLRIGFSTALALDCPPPNYSYSDKLQSLSIEMINQTDSSQTMDMTSIFGSNSESETYSIKDLIDIQYEEKGEFSIYLALLEYDSIYQNASFHVTATLESGKTFTQETEEIIFKD